MLLNGLRVSVLGGDGGKCGVGVGGLERVARWRVHRHSGLRHCGSVILACTRVSSFYRRLSQKYQTNRNNKWSLYAVMMVQVRVGDGDSGRRRLGPYEVSNTDVAVKLTSRDWERLPNPLRRVNAWCWPARTSESCRTCVEFIP